MRGMRMVHGALLTLAGASSLALTAWCLARRPAEVLSGGATQRPAAAPPQAGLTLQGLPRPQRTVAAARRDARKAADTPHALPGGHYLLVPVDVATGERVLGAVWDPPPEGPDPGPVCADATGRLSLPVDAIGPWGAGPDDLPPTLAQGFHVEGWELTRGGDAREFLASRLRPGETALPVRQVRPGAWPWRRVRLLDPDGSPASGLRVCGVEDWCRTGSDGVARFMASRSGDVAVLDASGAMVERLYVWSERRRPGEPPEVTLPRVRRVRLRFGPRGLQGEEGPVEAWLYLPFTYAGTDGAPRSSTWRAKSNHDALEQDRPAARFALDRWRWTTHEVTVPIDRDLFLTLARSRGPDGAFGPERRYRVHLVVTADDGVREFGWPLDAPTGTDAR